MRVRTKDRLGHAASTTARLPTPAAVSRSIPEKQRSSTHATALSGTNVVTYTLPLVRKEDGQVLGLAALHCIGHGREPFRNAMVSQNGWQAAT